MDFETIKAAVIKAVKEQPVAAAGAGVVFVALLLILIASSGPSRAEIEKQVWTARTLLTEVAETRRAVAALHWFAAETARRPPAERDALVADLAGLLDAVVELCAGLEAANKKLAEEMRDSMLGQLFSGSMCTMPDRLAKAASILVRNPDEQPRPQPSPIDAFSLPMPQSYNQQNWTQYLMMRDTDQFWLHDFVVAQDATYYAVWFGQNPGSADVEALETLTARAIAARDIAKRSYEKAQAALAGDITREVLPLCSSKEPGMAEVLVGAFSTTFEERMLETDKVPELRRWADAIAVDQETTAPGGLFRPSRLGMSMRHASLSVMLPREAVADAATKTRVEVGTALLVQPLFAPHVQGARTRQAEQMRLAYEDFAASAR